MPEIEAAAHASEHQAAATPDATPRTNLVWRHDLRVWREGIVACTVKLDTVLASRSFWGGMQDLALKSSARGRARALAALQAQLHDLAVFQLAKIDEVPAALWAAVTYNEASACASVDFVLISRGRASRGLWRLMIQAHAQQRFSNELSMVI